ncbi:MAG: hypothetical protein VX527_07695 [Planctomycetota bacterium]|nr:hypothetical protein [Planctomycetota bacterium]
MEREVHRMTVDEMEFGKVFRFGRVLKAIGSSLQPGRLALGVLVIALIGLGGEVSNWIGGTVPPGGLAADTWNGEMTVSQKRSVRRAADKWTELDLKIDSPVDPAVVLDAMRTQFATPGAIESSRMDAFMKDFDAVNGTRGRGPFEATVDWIGLQLARIAEGTLDLSAVTVIDAAMAIAWDTPRMLWTHGQWWFMLFMGLWTLLLIAVFGGALARMEAVQAAGGQRLGPLEATDFALSRFMNSYGSLLIPLVLAGALAGLLLLIGLLMNVPVLNILVAIFYAISLLIGLGVVLLLLGYIACGGMLIPAVAVENCDGGDAMQRAYSYMVTRPLHLILYVGIGLIGLGLGLILVLVLANAALAVTAGLQGAWTWNSSFAGAGGAVEIFSNIDNPSPGYSSWWTSLSGWFIGFWESVVVMLVLGWIFSYCCAAWTRIYLLMRRACDGLEEDTIWYSGLIPGTLAPESFEASESEAS